MEDFTERQKRVNRLFRLGYGGYQQGEPEPSNRVEAMGWRLAQRQAIEYKDAMEQAYEAFAELTRWDDLGYLD